MINDFWNLNIMKTNDLEERTLDYENNQPISIFVASIKASKNNNSKLVNR